MRLMLFDIELGTSSLPTFVYDIAAVFVIFSEDVSSDSTARRNRAACGALWGHTTTTAVILKPSCELHIAIIFPSRTSSENLSSIADPDVGDLLLASVTCVRWFSSAGAPGSDVSAAAAVAWL